MESKSAPFDAITIPLPRTAFEDARPLLPRL
jgi:hypothetical protein